MSLQWGTWAALQSSCSRRRLEVRVPARDTLHRILSFSGAANSCSWTGLADCLAGPWHLPDSREAQAGLTFCRVTHLLRADVWNEGAESSCRVPGHWATVAALCHTLMAPLRPLFYACGSRFNKAFPQSTPCGAGV